MPKNLNPFYRCTRKRIPRCLLTVGTCFSFAPIRSNSHIPHFVRKVVSVDYENGCIIDHFGHCTAFLGFPVYICVPR